MKVALVHDTLVEMGEAERVLDILCELFPDATVYTLFAGPDALSSVIRRMRLRTSALQRFPGIVTQFRYYAPLFPVMIEQFDFSDYDLVVSNNQTVAQGVLTSPDTCHICYCHPEVTVHWGGGISDSGSNLLPGPRLLRLAFGTYLRSWMVVSSQRVDAFLTGTRDTAAFIRKYYRRETVLIEGMEDRPAFAHALKEAIHRTFTEFQTFHTQDKPAPGQMITFSARQPS